MIAMTPWLAKAKSVGHDGQHNGMLSNEEYKQRWEHKLAAYRRRNIKPLEGGGGKNGTLLITEEKEGSGLAADEIKKNINAILGK
jgi:hypothetical protein